jgi:hypothetical protein
MVHGRIADFVVEKPMVLFIITISMFNVITNAQVLGHESAGIVSKSTNKYGVDAKIET